jgi:hypothetical protein
MFSHTFRRTVFCATVAMAMLVPAAQADDWARDRARDGGAELDPAIATAIRESKSAALQPVVLDPGIRTALEAATARSDDASGAAGPPRTSSFVGGRSLDVLEAARLARVQAPVAGVVPADRFHWADFGIGVGSAFGSMLLLAGLAAGILTTRRRRDDTGLAAS